MTDGQLAAIISALIAFGGGLGGVLKWTVGRITKALDDNTASREKQSESNVTLASAMAKLSTKIDGISQFVQEHTPVNQPIPRRPATPPKGTYIQHRPGSRHDGDE